MHLRWIGGDLNRIRALAQELVGLQPDIIVAHSTVATAALQRETLIPIVFAFVSDPVASGLVERLDRPGGNITGFANYEASSGGKWLELLSEITGAPRRPFGAKRPTGQADCAADAVNIGRRGGQCALRGCGDVAGICPVPDIDI
jgi:putative ABC transport system substrate-binding protein